MLLAKRLVALWAGLAFAGDLPVCLGVLDLPALANKGAGESGHLPSADPAAASPASGGSVAPRCRGVPWATPLPTHPGRRSTAEGGVQSGGGSFCGWTEVMGGQAEKEGEEGKKRRRWRK